jgi:sporulation protein YlmC with PRC-barrel domain
MPTIRTLDGQRVTGSEGRSLGRVSATVFHPSEPRVVGLQIDPDPLLWVIKRRARFAPLAGTTFAGDGTVCIATPKVPSDEKGERTIGASWFDTVVWVRMPVVSAEGESVGTVRDVVFDASTGAVTRLQLSTGAVGDAAIGRFEVDGEFVRGFDGESVVVEPGYRDMDASGGLAKAAAGAVVGITERGKQVASGLAEVGSAAAGAVRRSFKHGAGRRAMNALKNMMSDDE